MTDNTPMTDVKLAAIRARAGSMAHAMAKGKLAEMGLPGFRAVEDAWDDRITLLAEVERLRRALNPNWMEAAEIEHMRVKELEAEIAAMRPIVEVVAEVDNSDESACYVVCDLTLYDSETPDAGVRHNEPCIFEQARAFVTKHPVRNGGAA